MTARVSTRRSLSTLLRDDRRLKAALLLSCLLFLLAAASALGQFVWSERIDRADGCGFDGFYYCAMLNDEVVPKPFSQRILLPFLAKRVSTDGLAGFWVVNLLSLVGATLIVMFSASKLRSQSGRGGTVAYRLLPALLVGAAFLGSRNTFHIVATYPALSDPLALLLLVAAVALVAIPVHPSTRLLLIPVCFLAPLAREALAPILVLALVLAGLLRLLPRAAVLAASIASAAGGAFALNQPNIGAGQCLTPDDTIEPCPESIASTFRFWLDWDFGSWEGFFRFSVMLLLALGPLVLALTPLRSRLWSTPAALWLVGVAAIFTAVSVFGGGDTDRILTPAALLLVLAVVLAADWSGRQLLGLSLIVAAYFVQQKPLSAVDGDSDAWLEFFGLRVTTTEAVVQNGLVPILIALPLGIAGCLFLRSRGKEPEAQLTRTAGDSAQRGGFDRR